jgi:23S rRNA (guanosine2251-2'-O)-methyltransferase
MNLICGINPVLEALQAGTRQFDRLLVVKGLRNRRVSEAIARASQSSVPLRFETRETLDRLAAGVPHQGIIAVVSPKPVMGVHELLAAARDPALVLVLDGVEDPRNLGAILRTAEAAGADGVLLPERHSAGLSETVARASAGALEHVKVARIGNVTQALGLLKERGIWVIGLDANGERWDKIDFKKPVALVLGGEGRGMRRLVREHCDEVAALPLFGHVTSLNVSVAAGAVMYEVVRQRGTMPSHVRPIPPSARPPVPTQITGPAADDGESDPGLLPPAPPAEASDEEDEAPNLSLVQIHEGEDAAWRLPASGPPSERRVTRSDGREPSRERGRGDRDRGDRGDRRGRRDRPGGGHKPQREERSADAPLPAPRSPEGGAPSDAPPAEVRGDRPGGDRRRRRRRRRGGRPPGADANGNPERSNGHPHEHSSGGGDRDAEPGNGSDDPVPARSENGAPPAEGAPNGAPGAGSDARRRRRRRRRH